MFNSIYFSQLSYFVASRSVEWLREVLGRDKLRMFMILSIDLSTLIVNKHKLKAKVLTTLADSPP